jgi:hypothetical protein
MTTEEPSAKRQLLEMKYDGDIAGDIAGWIAGGISWRSIRDRVQERTGFNVSYESLRNWYGKEHAA